MINNVVLDDRMPIRACMEKRNDCLYILIGFRNPFKKPVKAELGRKGHIYGYNPCVADLRNVFHLPLLDMTGRVSGNTDALHDAFDNLKVLQTKYKKVVLPYNGFDLSGNARFDDGIEDVLFNRFKDVLHVCFENGRFYRI